jgi:hypothetical protein
MLGHRVTRGYFVLIAGLAAFFARRALAGEPLWSAELMGAEIRGDTELWIVVMTTVLITQAVAAGRLRAMLIALPFALPPLMLFLTFYPTVIVLMMLAMLPWLIHAALSSWMPTAPSASG